MPVIGRAPASAAFAASAATASVIVLPASTRSAACTRHGTGATAPITMRADFTVDPDITRFTDAAASGQSCDCLKRTSYAALRWPGAGRITCVMISFGCSTVSP